MSTCWTQRLLRGGVAVAATAVWVPSAADEPPAPQKRENAPVRMQTPPARGAVRPPADGRGARAANRRNSHGRAPTTTSPPTDPSVARRLGEARQLLREGQIDRGLQLVQSVLDEGSDSFLRAESTPAGTNPDDALAATDRWIPASRAAEELILSGPPDVLARYRTLQEDQAASLLREADRRRRASGWGEVARRFFLTRAGREAVDRLASYNLDLGRVALAVFYFDRLASSPAHGAESSETHRMKRAAALALLWGDAPAAAEAALGGRNVSAPERLDQLLRDAESFGAPEPASRGARSASAPMPLLAPDWQSPLVRSETTASRFVAPIQSHPNRSQPLWTGYEPAVVGDRVFFRDFDGTWVFDASTGRIVGEVKGANTLSNEAARLDPRWAPSSATPGANYYMFLGNQVYGAMTTDGKRVFQVDDLSLSPSPFQTQVARSRSPDEGPSARENSVRAIDAETLEVVWRVDGKSSSEIADGVYFLGPPLAVEGELYVLGEARSEIRLFAIDAEEGCILWQEVLALCARGIETDLFRRTQACRLAYADGVLICPTNLFHVVAVDPATRARLWEYSTEGDGPAAVQYAASASQSLAPPPGALPADRPVYASGRVILSEPLGASFHCVDLHSGEQVWQTERGRDWYVAGAFGDRALFVGPERIRTLSLRDGRELWSRPVDEPSGRGVQVGEWYLLPTVVGQVVAVDPREGRIVDRAAARERRPIGNLTLSSGRLFAAGVGGLAAYSLESDVRAEVDRLLAEDPEHPRGLFRRAQLHLSKGRASDGIDDLRRAVRRETGRDGGEPSRDLLFDVAGNEAMRAPEAMAGLVEDLGRLARTPAELGIHLRLAAEHHVRSGRLPAAIDAVRRHTALDLGGFIPSETPDVQRSPAVWTRSFLSKALAMIDDESRATVEKDFRARLATSLERGDLDAARQLSRDLTGSPLGAEVRLALAESLLERRAPAEAEVALLEAAESRTAASAAARSKLAQWAEEEGRPADARRHLTDWRRRSPSSFDGAGESPREALARFDARHADVRSTPARVAWDFDRVSASSDKSAPFRPDSSKRIVFPHAPEETGFRTWLVSFDQQRWDVEFRGRSSGDVDWKLENLPRAMHYLQDMKYYSFGSLMFLAQADAVYAISGLERRLVWSRSFRDSTIEPVRVVTTDARVRVVPRSTSAYGVAPWPTIQAAGPGRLVVRFEKSLHVVDPWTGEDLWIRETTGPGESVGVDSEAMVVLGRDERTAVYRTFDGRALAAAEGGPEHRYRKGFVGRRTLLFQNDDPRKRVVRLYDPWKKVDYWSATLPATTEWHFADEERILLVDRGKSLRVLDAATGEVLFRDDDLSEDANSPPAGPVQYQYFSDGAVDYVTSAASGPGQSPWPVSPSPNLKALQVHGWIRAYDRRTGSRIWSADMRNRAVVASPGEELPVLLAIGNRMVDLGDNRKKLATSLEVLDKRDGRVLYTEDHDQYGTMLELAYAASERWVELRGFNLRIRLNFLKDGEDVQARVRSGREAAEGAAKGLLDRARLQRAKNDRER